MVPDSTNRPEPGRGGEGAIDREVIRLDIPDADVHFYPAFFPSVLADRLRQEVGTVTAWRQDKIQLYGQLRDIPRSTAWYGDEGATYTYSRITNVPLPWTEPLVEIKKAIEPVCGAAFNGVLLNRYRNGQDSVSWHSDDEGEFGVLNRR